MTLEDLPELNDSIKTEENPLCESCQYAGGCQSGLCFPRFFEPELYGAKLEPIGKAEIRLKDNSLETGIAYGIYNCKVIIQDYASKELLEPKGIPLELIASYKAIP